MSSSKTLPISGDDITGSWTTNTTLTVNGTSLYPNITLPPGMVINYSSFNTLSNHVIYEPIHPIGVNDNRTGKRLIIWEP